MSIPIRFLLLTAALVIAGACTSRPELDINSPLSPAQTVRDYWKAAETNDLKLFVKCSYRGKDVNSKGELEDKTFADMAQNVLDQLSKIVTSQGGIKSVDVKSQQINGNAATVIYDLQLGNGKTREHLTDQLVKDDGRWTISGN
jgi:hypothetical protein